jgi:hypothetical protein
MRLDVIFASTVVMLAGLAVIGALILGIVWEWCAIRRMLHAHRRQALLPGGCATRPGVDAARAVAIRTIGRWLSVGWMLAALATLGQDGRLPIFLAWVTPSTLLVLGIGALVGQQRAPSFLDQPSLPYRYRVADDLGQPIAAVVAAAEHEATLTPGLGSRR